MKPRWLGWFWPLLWLFATLATGTYVFWATDSHDLAMAAICALTAVTAVIKS